MEAEAEFHLDCPDEHPWLPPVISSSRRLFLRRNWRWRSRQKLIRRRLKLITSSSRDGSSPLPPRRPPPPSQSESESRKGDLLDLDVSSDTSSSDLMMVASPSPLERKIKTPLSLSFSHRWLWKKSDWKPKKKKNPSLASLKKKLLRSEMILDTTHPEDKSPNCYVFAPLHKAHRMSTKWPCQANCKTFEEYYRQYLDIVEKSEGFTSFHDPTSFIIGGIRPCAMDKYVEELANFAVQEHNKKGANLLTLNKVVKANSQMRRGLVYYITLEAAAKGEGAAGAGFYETIVQTALKRGKSIVQDFRRAEHYNPNY